MTLLHKWIVLTVYVSAIVGVIVVGHTLQNRSTRAFDLSKASVRVVPPPDYTPSDAWYLCTMGGNVSIRQDGTNTMIAGPLQETGSVATELGRVVAAHNKLIQTKIK